MMDSIKMQLKLQKSSLSSSANLYECLINSSLMTSTPKRIEDMKEHHQGIVNQSNHQDFKLNNTNCLNCSQVLTCLSKCKSE